MVARKKIGLHRYVLLFVYSCLWEIFMLGMKMLARISTSVHRHIKHRKVSADFLKQIRNNRKKHEPAVIFYCSSAGEYEQALPLIDLMAANFYIHIIFFSTTGYEYARAVGEKHQFSLAPPDTLWGWRPLFHAIQPTHSIIVRHEFWPCFILLAAKHSKLFAVDISVKNELGSLSRWVRLSLFKYFHTLFFVSDTDYELLYGTVNSKGRVTNKITSKVVGNTKFDRAIQKKTHAVKKVSQYNHVLNKHTKAKRLIIGSAYIEDVKIVLNAYLVLDRKTRADWIILVVPHDIKTNNISQIKNACDQRGISYGLFDDFTGNPEVIIVNRLGMLADLYGCCDAAIIGGGFKQGVHNIVEPAVYLIPMACGKITQTDREAYSFDKYGVLKTIDNTEELRDWWEQCLIPNEVTCNKSRQLLDQHVGASNRILAQIKQEDEK